LYLKPFGGKRIFHLFNFNPNPLVFFFFVQKKISFSRMKPPRRVFSFFSTILQQTTRLLLTLLIWIKQK
jgi:hypothetical protein